MDDTFTSLQGIKFRGFTASLNADRTTEQHIIAFCLNFKKSIDGFAYGLHDKDRYTVAEVAKRQKMYDEIIEAGGTPDFDVPKVGDLKPAHWHIVCTFKNGVFLIRIAELLNCEPNLIRNLKNPKKSLLDGFGNMLAYLTHITDDAIKDGKHVYDSDIVKGLQFPQKGQYAVLYKDFQNYDDFRHTYGLEAFNKDSYLVQIMKGTLTPKKLKESDPDYYIRNCRKVHEARLEYINGLPTPDCVTNYYIGSRADDRDQHYVDFAHNGVQMGRTGKSTASLILAKALLESFYQEKDFDSMTKDELKEYIYWVGCSGVAFQDYDGQPILIWDDTRPNTIIDIFKSTNELYKAIDRHPDPTPLHIKFGDVYLKNKVNIFNGTKSYCEFLRGLGEGKGSYKYNNYCVDISQISGRIPFGMEISKNTVKQFADFKYCTDIPDDMNFTRSLPNILPVLAETGDTPEYRGFFTMMFLQAEDYIRNHADEFKKTPSDIIKQACIELHPKYCDAVEMIASEELNRLLMEERQQFENEYQNYCQHPDSYHLPAGMDMLRFFFETHQELFL